jgi:hypothetical protein
MSLWRKRRRNVVLLGSAFLVCFVLALIAFLVGREDAPVAATGRVFDLHGSPIRDYEQNAPFVGGEVELSYGGTYPASCEPAPGTAEPCSYETHTQYKPGGTFVLKARRTDEMKAAQESYGFVRLLIRAYFEDHEQGRCVLAKTIRERFEDGGWRSVGRKGPAVVTLNKSNLIECFGKPPDDAFD